MKYLILALSFMVFSSYGATCTTTTRTNYSTGQVLTSTALNADFNQLVSKINGLDGGCITDGTLEASALNSTDFGALRNGVSQGCALTLVDSNTIGIGACMLSVNGNFVKTTTQTNVTWGCTSCAAEVSATQYYLYAKSNSTGTTLNGLISTTAPGADGLNGSGDKIIGKFYNNANSDIMRQSLLGFNGYGYGDSLGSVGIYGSNLGGKVFGFYFYGANKGSTCSSDPCNFAEMLGSGVVSSIDRITTGSYTLNLNFAINKNKTVCLGSPSTGLIISPALGFYADEATALGTSVDFFVSDETTGVDSYGFIMCFTE